MKYEQIRNLLDEPFRRLTGVKRQTFEKMVKILVEDDNNKKIKGGRKNKLSLENQLLMALEYIREYRTYFHISKSYGKINRERAGKGTGRGTGLQFRKKSTLMRCGDRATYKLNRQQGNLSTSKKSLQGLKT